MQDAVTTNNGKSDDFGDDDIEGEDDDNENAMNTIGILGDDIIGDIDDNQNGMGLNLETSLDELEGDKKFNSDRNFDNNNNNNNNNDNSNDNNGNGNRSNRRVIMIRI